MSGEFGTGKTIFVLAIVVGCFAVLWPKIFYPMLTASITSPSSGRQVLWKDEANVFFLHQLCYLLEEQHHVSAEAGTSVRWTGEECWQVLKTSCGVEVSEALVSDVRLGKDKSNLTNCLATRYSLTPALVAAAAPPRVRPRPYLPQGMGPHARPERPPHLYPEMMHPALREKGRAMPQRTIDKQARPGPMPGVRPPMGGAGGIVPPPQTKGSGAMGIIMPLYTVGIVVFFVYTIMKVLFKKGQDDDKTPKLKDFGLDPEYRKYVFAEEYLDNTDVSSKDQMRRQAREESRNRKKAQNEVPPDTKIEDEQLDQLRRRLEETEKAMERLMCQMGSVTDKLTAAKITEVLSQAQAQAKILKIGLDTVLESAAASTAAANKKEEVGEMTSEEDLTSSEALTTTMSEETSLPASLQRHLEEIQVEQSSNFSDLLKEMDQLQLEAVPAMEVALNGTLPQAEVTGAMDDTDLQEPPLTSFGDSIPANRTIIQLQALKDDCVTTEELKEAPPESLPEASESKENYLPEEQPVVEDVEISELPEEKKDTILEEEKELQKETLSDPEMVHDEPPHPSGTSETGEKPELINEVDAEEAVALPVPAFMETDEKPELINEVDAEEAVALPVPAFMEDATKPTAELPVLLVREISSEGSSEATETGADISELRSFAEENGNKEHAQSDIPAPQKIIPPPVMEVSVEKDEESESVCKGQGTQTSFAFSAPTPHINSKEFSTQTEKEQEVAVLGMNTSFRHDEGGVETKGNSQGPVPSHQVTEILLDALLPSETQLLVKDSQVVGSSHAQDIEIEASEAGAVPCVVTSNVSLAFLGLEQRDDITPTPTNNSTLIADEDVPENKHQEVKDVPMLDENAPDTVCQEANETPKADEDVLDNGQQELKDTSIVNKDVPDDVPQEVGDIPQPESQALETEKQEVVPSPSLASNTVTPVSELVDLPPEELTGMSQEAGSLVLSELSVKTEADTNKECTKASDHTTPNVPEKADLEPRNEVKDILEPEKEKQKSALIPDRSIGEQPAEVLPRPSSPLPPRIPEDQEELEEEEEEQEQEQEEQDQQQQQQQQQREKEHEIVSQIPITPSLEAIAEAVAAATTRAALDVLATSKPETFFSPEELQEIATKSTFLTEEIPTDQSPLSTDESSSATTVVAVSETGDAIVSNTQPQNDTETAASETSSQSSVVYVATISHSPSGSPSSTPEMELSGQAVEAALAEAALEEASNTSVVKPIMHEEPAAQEGPGATTVSPKNEDSPTSSKGSSPDMDEYEVITKEEDHTTTTTKVKKLKEGAETAKNEPKLTAAATQKVEDISQEVEEEAENEEEEEEEEEEIEEEVEFQEVPKKDSATKRPAVDASAKTMPKSAAATEETSDDE